MLPAVYGGAGIRDPEADAIGWMRASAWAGLVRRGDLPPDLSWPDFDGSCAFAQPVSDDELAADVEVGPMKAGSDA
jgi:hypothetical protein